ncbi:hypothetical protein Patl1_09529 [Pistacia atlantica]|uniref:Uncharacterized protein n=1 Tax=Pistacia atlantica TaxID=434234 RepID=A0ACC1AKC3_9ROSI|nr:hypothetical protein Patl1_09529 [Pistacia atlantica]
METEEPSPTDTLAISLHAMTSFPNPQTMRVKGRVHNRVALILIDLGRSHNFVNKDFVDSVGLQLNHKGKFNAIVASGESLTSSGKCDQVQVILQDIPLTIDLYLLHLEGYDVVLGTQWLQTLGPITWDFSKMRMRFRYEGREVILQGELLPENKLFNSHQIE